MSLTQHALSECWNLAQVVVQLGLRQLMIIQLLGLSADFRQKLGMPVRHLGALGAEQQHGTTCGWHGMHLRLLSSDGWAVDPIQRILLE